MKHNQHQLDNNLDQHPSKKTIAAELEIVQGARFFRHIEYVCTNCELPITRTSANANSEEKICECEHATIVLHKEQSPS